MSKKSAEEINVSQAFRKRVISLIADEECNNKEFAARVGISANTVSNITNYGIIPSVRSLVKIADYLNLPLLYLLARSERTDFEKSDAPVGFHTRLLQLKEEAGVKYADITNHCTCPANSIRVWISRNMYPSLDYLLEIANYFQVSPDYLLGRTDYKKQ